jgi:catalase (peroxidase I)
MRFAPESAHGANAGLAVARQRLESVKAKHPDISYSDLWSLAGVVAIQEMGGPDIPWRPGRRDADGSTRCTPDGRLPDASKKAARESAAAAAAATAKRVVSVVKRIGSQARVARQPPRPRVRLLPSAPGCPRLAGGWKL